MKNKPRLYPFIPKKLTQIEKGLTKFNSKGINGVDKNTNIIILSNKLYDIGPERKVKMNLIESVKAIFPSQYLVKDNTQTNHEFSKPKTDEPQKSFKEILNEVKTDRDGKQDKVFISAEGRDSFKVNKAIKDGVEMNKECNESCNHDPNSEESSLKMLPRRTMVAPAQFDFVCKECKKGFKFVKDNDTKKYVEYDGFNNENK